MKWWYRILNVVAILLKILSAALWIVQAGYSATQGEVHSQSLLLSGYCSTFNKWEHDREDCQP